MEEIFLILQKILLRLDFYMIVWNKKTNPVLNGPVTFSIL